MTGAQTMNELVLEKKLKCDGEERSNSYKSPLEILFSRAEKTPDQDAFVFLDEKARESRITYAQLAKSAQSIGVYLRQYSEAGDRAILCYAPSLDFIKAFFGCLYGGIVAVPLYPPHPRERNDRIEKVISSCQCRLLLSQRHLAPILSAFIANEEISGKAALQLILTDEIEPAKTDEFAKFSILDDTLAFLQYTSGSTGEPKGVMINHGNILANLAALEETTGCHGGDTFVNWLPLFHDLGLINTVLLPVYLGATSVQMSPLSFIQRPRLWFEAITKYRGSIGGAPNFAYNLCVDKIRTDETEGLDLASWRIAFNAAEPISADTLKKFSEAYSHIGFQETAFYPSYGMAEATVFLTGGKSDDKPRIQHYDVKQLLLNHAKQVHGPQLDNRQNYRALVGCGYISSAHSLKIVDPETCTEIPEGEVGEIWVNGPSISQGYWGLKAFSKETFKAKLDGSQKNWLRTGDLGFLDAHELFVTGRIKDLIIVRGENYYPTDIEHSVQSCHRALKEGRGAAFQVESEESSGLIIVQEVERQAIKGLDIKDVFSKVLQRIVEDYRLVPEAIVLIKPATIPKTSSGKVQRRLCKQQFLDKSLNSIARYEPDQSELSFQHDPQITDTEKKVLDVLQAVLKRKEIGVSDNFFEAGMDSLAFAEATVRLREEFSLPLSDTLLFEYPTARNLSAYLNDMERDPLPDSAPSLELLSEEDRAKGVALSHGQESLWFIWKLARESSAYNLSRAFRLKGNMDIRALERSFAALIDRHEILRTHYVEREGLPLQVIGHDIEVTLIAQALDESDMGAALQQEVQRPFDLNKGNLMRVKLYACSAEDHVLQVTMHHSITDGWSMGIMCRELTSFYDGFRKDKPVFLPTLAFQYADYARWQRLSLSGERLENELSYWKSQLKDLPPVHNLPLDKPRPLQRSFSGRTGHQHIDAVLKRKLEILCQSQKVTLFMLLHSAFSVLLKRYSNESDIVVGAATAGRTHRETESLVGFFVNTLILRDKFGVEICFSELLQNNKRMILDAYAHQHVQFEVLVEEINPQRNLSYSPVFQIVFSMQDDEWEDLSFSGVSHEVVSIDVDTVKYDLVVNAAELSDGLSLSWSYNTDIFFPETIERLSNSFELILKGIADTPDLAIHDLDILTDADKRKLLVDWNAASMEFPEIRCIHELFEEQAELHPRREAVVYEDDSITYEQLNAQSNQLAHYLVEQGVGPGSLVALCVERSLEMIVGILGILKAGGAYIPLDPDYPAARLRYMLTDSAAQLVLTSSGVLQGLDLEGHKIFLLDREIRKKLLATYPTSSVAMATCDFCPHNLAYVIYTSGSTGQPKGVMLSHDNLVKSTLSRLFHYKDQPTSFLLFSSFAFDSSVAGIFWTLSAGGKLCLIGSDTMKDFRKVEGLLVDEKVSHLLLLPNLYGRMLEADVRPPASITTVIVAGEECKQRVVEQHFTSSSWQVSRLVNEYGPTETCVWTSMYDCSLHTTGMVSIGSPVAHARCYVMDNSGRLLPVGVIGELYIGGYGVSRGYLNRPELTAERFIPNPFYNLSDSQSSEYLYRTVDLARWLPDGNLEFMGRADEQVKVRGFRIELGEIESQLRQIKGVRDCVVLAREEAGTDKRLVAYVVDQGLSDLMDADDVEQAETLQARKRALSVQYQACLQDILPDYMVPGVYVFLDALPLTPNGKVDKEALPATDVKQQLVGYVAPTNDIEAQLCEMWQDILHLDQVGIEDNFFALGGHSLLVMQMIAGLQHMGRALNVRDVFDAPVLKDMAKRIEATTIDAGAFIVPSNSIPPGIGTITPEMLPLIDLSQEEIGHVVSQVPGAAGNIQDIYPLSSFQEGILFHHRMSTETDPYTTSVLFKARNKSSLLNFRDSLQFIIARHDVWRTAVLWDGLLKPVQVVYRQAELSMIWLDPLTVEDSSSAFQKMVQLARPMDVRQAPLQQLHVAGDPHSDGYWVLFQFHHLASDHVALDIILEELHLHQKKEAERLAEPVPYRKFVAYTQYQAGENDAEEYFRRVLGDVEAPTFLFDLVDVQGDGSRSKEAREVVPEQVSQRLRAVARTLQISPAILFHTAWALVVAGCSSRDDVVFGTVVSGRLNGILGVETMPGVFINTLPLRVQLKRNSVSESVEQVRRSLQGLLPFEQAPLALAQKCSALPGNTPLFNSLLNYRHSRPRERTEKILESAQLELLAHQTRTNFPFVVQVDDFGSSFELGVQVDKTVSATRVLSYLQTAVESLITALEETPSLPVTQLGILPKLERQIFLEGWNDTEAEYRKGSCIHELFEEQVRKHPQQVALMYEGVPLTYQQLNEQSNRLAHYLIEQGVKPDSLVALCVERSPEMVVGILGILKAGGGYLPLNPGYPVARIEYMLHDAEVDMVLTQDHLLPWLPLRKQKALSLDLEMLEVFLGGYSKDNICKKSLGLSSENLAYTIYTSGSTGEQKGVMIAHDGLVSYCDYALKHYYRPDLDGSLLATSYSFDLTIPSLFLPLLAGGHVFLLGETEVLGALAEELSRTEHSYLLRLTPSHLKGMLALLKRTAISNNKHVFVIGGEPLPSNIVDELNRILPNAVIYNHYGPTEAIIGCCIYPHASNASSQGYKYVPIGRPMSNVLLYVLGKEMKLQPMGVVGELYIGGVGLARGYMNQPALTVERFIGNPFSESSDARLYKTGDLVRWLADGNLEFVGREDHQVKLRGFRIELGEIESQLQQLEGVKDSVVLCREDDGIGKHLVAYVVAHEFTEPSFEDLNDDQANAFQLRKQALSNHYRSQLQTVLPEYMVPGLYVFLESLPLTPNGKVDKNALPVLSRAQHQAMYVAPENSTEEQLCSIWENILDLDRVGVEDDFFTLGGDSLLAMRLTSELRQKYEIEIPLKEAFSLRTVRNYAEYLINMHKRNKILISGKESRLNNKVEIQL